MLGRFSRVFRSYSKSCACILSGCGYGDGAEITESVSTIVNLVDNDVEVTCFSLDRPQFHVLNHITFEEIEQERNCLVESTRISRDPVNELHTLNVDDFDFLVIPGGFGVAKNLCDFAFKGEEFEIEEIVEEVIMSFYDNSKPIGAVCISPMLIAKLLGEKGVKLTLGDSDEGVNSVAESFGAVVEIVENDGIVVCEENKVVTTPAYMSSDVTPASAFHGIRKMVETLMELC